MIYTEHDKLTIIESENVVDSLSFDELGRALQERPANVIYCEHNKKLYGIVSMGDIARAKSEGKSYVNVNRRFTSVKPNEYMKVRQLFEDNEKINAVPVIEEDGRLLGDYIRWDDLLVLEHMGSFFEENQYATRFWKVNNRVALVKPCDLKKILLFNKWKPLLESKGVRVEAIDRLSIPEYIDKVNLVLFTDEDELRGGSTLIDIILGKKYISRKCSTYKRIRNTIEQYIKYETGEKIADDNILNLIKDAGAHILLLQCKDNGSEYYQRLVNDEIPKKYNDAGMPISSKLPASAVGDFFEGLPYTEEDAEYITVIPSKTEQIDGVNRLKDISGKYYNVKDGERLTIGQPSKYNRTVYFFGQCPMIGIYVEDKHTIESFLQARCNEMLTVSKVVNLGCYDNLMGTLNRIIQTPIRKEDIVVVFIGNREIQGLDNLNLAEVLQNNNVPAKWFADAPMHCNYKVNEIFADAIYKKLRTLLEAPSDPPNELIGIDKNIVVDTCIESYIKCYFADFKFESHGEIGSIIMNCNPFTNGHRFLIEEALKRVDFLIIFVVEEDKSSFSFAERFAFVKEGVADLINVMVVPSGQFILSQRTFPEYFVKVADEDIVKNVEYDLTLFAEWIAPKLNITYRFVGEEPDDTVTNEYNQAMKRILPKRGINVIEIPRKNMMGGGTISASLARKCLADNDYDKLVRLIPQSTWDILF